MTVCKRVKYSGRVQGVGFRYTTLGLSRSYDVVGTIRNCSDGSVELVVQGATDQIAAFLNAIEERMAGYITEQNVQEMPAIEVKSFQIIG